jgi:mono/diheme cytochrome c family protein
VGRRRAEALTTRIEDIQAHLDRGAPWDACDAFRDAVAKDPGNARLLYWGALAHARAGALQTAHAVLDEAERYVGQQDLRADIESLRGRLYKDAYHRAPEREGAAVLLARARDQYRRAYAQSSDSYPGINAASLSMLLGEREEAQRIAREVLAHAASPAPKTTAWHYATRGEAVYAEQKCALCHSIGDKGNRKGPLDGVGTKLSADELRKWIVDAKGMTAKANAPRKPEMKNYALPKEDVDALVAYMGSLKKK